jgi:adenylate cyclase, class 1
MRIREQADREGSLRIFGRRLLENQHAFILNNIKRIKEMLQDSTPAFRSVFQSIPFLIQINKSNMPGYIDHDDPARGIVGFERSRFARLLEHSGMRLSAREVFLVRPHIQSLMLIGSTGSMGQTAFSDLDYWVMVDRKHVDDDDLVMVEEKLMLIADWAAVRHGVEVHFFTIDLDDIVENRLGKLDDDSSGDIMPGLLKEEFYRTMLHVAGRMPLWWAVPAEMTPGDYENTAKSLADIELTTFDPYDFIDLGYPFKPDPREYIGAAMWQAHKGGRDPFKSVLKMMLLLEQVEGSFSLPLLCDEFKKRVLAAGPDDSPVDPYRLMIERILLFTESMLPENMDLVRISVWFKLMAPWDRRPLRLSSSRLAVIEDLALEWGWDETKRRDMSNYHDWPPSRKLKLGGQVKELLFNLYSRIAARLRSAYPDEVRVADTGLTRLNAQILGRWADHKHKVEDLPSSLHGLGLPDHLNIVRENEGWLIVDASRSTRDTIYQAPRLARIAAWLINNRLWQPQKRLNVQAGGRPMKSVAFHNLIALLYKTFPPIRIEAISEQSLLPRPEGPLVLVVNLEESGHESRLVTAEYIYRTSLGEMCHELQPLLNEKNEVEKYLTLAHTLFNDHRVTWDSIIFFVPQGEAEDELRVNIMTSLKSIDLKYRKQQRHEFPKSELKLDLD